MSSACPQPFPNPDGPARLTDRPEDDSPLADYIRALLASPRFGRQITCHHVLPEREALHADPRRPWSAAVRKVLETAGIPALYSHQAAATDLIRAGHNVVAATPTASGKSLIYNLPVIERFLHDSEATALYLFPLKALAQDQAAAFNALTSAWPKDARPSLGIYDGDTSDHFRRKIRRNPPSVLVTNPEMLHLAVLPHHQQWTTFLAALSLVVVDEVHSYRGVWGAHMAQLFRRLRRVAGLYGASPAFVSCSATIGNPAELAETLTGLPARPVLKSGAPQGKRHFVFINPEDSPATTAIQLLRAALARGLRTIVYAQSRRMTELISIWAAEQSGPYAKRISAYRAGFLPEERRGIEARMASGELLAVITTSALELGIDIGTLDLCILVGYPGTIMATLQRGGRVGRARQESAVALIAQEDALDQYIVRHGAEFFSRPPERAVCNPENPVILERHLECAAAEYPLKPQGADAAWLSSEGAREALSRLEADGLLLRSADGATLHAARKRPQRHVDLRGAGASLVIQDQGGAVIGSVDAGRAMREAHPGAVYLHRGRSYVVTELDLPGRTVRVAPGKPAYYTRARGNKTTEILSLAATRTVGGSLVSFGKLRVTEYITGYEKRATRDGRLLGVVPLDFPPNVFETEGLWFTIPEAAQRATEEALLHFMGAIHALEHAAIGILPLLVMTDRNDLGGISTPMHPQVAAPAVFIYDGLPGGAGLSREAFAKADELFARTLDVVTSCPCETGCPACVHSPKCGSGNRPIDKAGARFLLEAVMAAAPDAQPVDLSAPVPPPPRPVSSGAPFIPPSAQGAPPQGVSPMTQAPRPDPARVPARYAVLDVETRLSAEEVGGWHKAHRMGVSVAVLYDSGEDRFTPYSQEELPALAVKLAEFELIVGFNILRFDYAVLTPHMGGLDPRTLPTLDMLAKVHERLSYRLSLDNLAQATLSVGKSADGLQALQWWKEGKIEQITEYCRRDVAVTRDLYLFGRENGYLLFTNKAKQLVRVPVDW